MKEFVEKLIARLEERKKVWTVRGTEFSHAGGTTIVDEMAFGTGNGLYKAIEITKQLAEEYNNDFCEWRLCDEEANVYDTTCRNPHIFIEGSPKDNNYEFCPYCGKRIKVVE